MKKIIYLLLILFLSASCSRKENAIVKSTTIEASQPDTLPKAKAILWIDKPVKKLSDEQRSGLRISNVKVKVNITENGTVEILEYVKPQNKKVQTYLYNHLQSYRVSQNMLNSYMKPGIHYVFLRYMTDKVY